MLTGQSGTTAEAVATDVSGASLVLAEVEAATASEDGAEAKVCADAQALS